MQVGHDETGFEDAHGEDTPNLHIYTWVDLLEKKHTVEGHAIVQNLPTSQRRVYAPLKRRIKGGENRNCLGTLYINKKQLSIIVV